MARDARSGSYPTATPTVPVDTYLRGHQVGGLQVLPRGNHRAGVVLQSLTVIDRAAGGIGFDVYLFDAQPTLASSNGTPFDLTDSEMNKCVGVVSLYNHEYVGNLSSSVVTRSQIGIGIRVVNYDVYAVAVSRNMFTLGIGESDPFTFRYHFELERV